MLFYNFDVPKASVVLDKSTQQWTGKLYKLCITKKKLCCSLDTVYTLSQHKVEPVSITADIHSLWCFSLEPLLYTTVP